MAKPWSAALLFCFSAGPVFSQTPPLEEQVQQLSQELHAREELDANANQSRNWRIGTLDEIRAQLGEIYQVLQAGSPEVLPALLKIEQQLSQAASQAVELGAPAEAEHSQRARELLSSIPEALDRSDFQAAKERLGLALHYDQMALAAAKSTPSMP